MSPYYFSANCFVIFSLKAKVDGTEVPEDKPLEEDEKNKELNLQR